MAWTIEVTPAAAKQIKRLVPANALRIRNYLRERLGALDDPRQIGKPLKGSELGSFWRYRVGDFRLLCEIRMALVVLVLEVGQRRGVYR